MLKALKSDVGTSRHCAVGKWLEFLLVERMTYFALFTAIRVPRDLDTGEAYTR